MVQLSDEKLDYLKKSIPRKIGKRVKHFRKEKGLTQTRLAELVGKDRQYLYKIEKGIVTANIVTISALVAALEISFKDFFDIDIN